MTFSKPRRKVDRVFIHCSASDNPAHDNVATMDKWHKARGWSGVGYHFFIRKSGLIEEGRPLERVPAAQAGNNTGTIAICLHGLLESKFTEEQFKSLVKLCQEIDVAYFGKVTFWGHNEVANKACPVFDHAHVLGLDSNRHMGTTEPSGRPNKPDTTASRLLRRGDKGDDVRALQTHLMGLGHDVGPVDGIFGPATEKAVFRFQRDNKLRV